MISFDVDVDELTDVVAAMGACQRAFLDLAADVDAHHRELQAEWSGRAADAEEASHQTWRGGCADMVSTLAGLRAIATRAETHYRDAVAANLALWEQVR